MLVYVLSIFFGLTNIFLFFVCSFVLHQCCYNYI